MKKINTITIVLVLLFSVSCYGQSWLDISPISGEILVTDTAKDELNVDINDINMRPVYKLSCKSGDANDEKFNFSGLFHCRLISLYSKEKISSLLIEELPQTADWDGRARFLLNHVLGQCAEVPDWGANRVFRLRKMKIVLEINNVDLTGDVINPKIKSFNFNYKLIPDNTALSSISLGSSIKEPFWFSSGNNCVKEFFKK